MQFGRLILIGAALAALVPVATADILLSGDITTTGTATIRTTVSATEIVFANTDPTPTDLHYLQSPGAVTATSGSLDAVAPGLNTSMWYVPDATSTKQNINGRYEGRTIANLVFTGPTAPTVAIPQLFYQVFDGANTLDFYITDVTGVTLGTKTVDAGFTASGYVTLNGVDMTDGICTYTLTDLAPNLGKQAFTSTFVIPVPPPPPPPPPPTIPEPSSLALLGTGVIGVAGFVFRKRGKIEN